MSNRDTVRKKRLILNISFSLFYEFIMVCYGFVLPRLYISYYGSNVNGLMTSITKFLGFVSIAELGVGTVVTSNLYKPLAEKDWKLVSQIVASAKRFYRFIALGLAIYTVVLTVIFPLFITNAYSPIYVISLILIISVSSFAQYFFGISYTLVLKANQKDYVNIILNSITVVLNIVFCSLFILNGSTIHIARGVTSIIYVVRPFILMLYVKKNYDINMHEKVTGEPIKQKWNGLAQHIAYIVQDNTDTIVLTVFSTLENVSIYSVYYNVVNGVKKIVNSINSGMSSLLGNVYASDEKEKLTKIFSQYEWLIHTFSTLLFGVTAVLIVPFVSVYTRGITDANYIQPLFGLLISTAILLWCYQRPYNMMVQAAIKYKETQIYSIIEPIINVVISVVLVKSVGLVGVAIGTGCSMAYRMVFLMEYLTKDVLFLKKSQCIKRIVVDVFMYAIIFAISYFVKLHSLTYGAWIILAIKVFGVAFGITILINLLFYKDFTMDFVKSITGKFRRHRV